MSKAELGAGDIPITIDGQEYILRPTLAAATTLSRNNGLQGSVQRCLSLDFEEIVRVVEAGLGRSSRDLREKLYKTGMRNINAPCITFLTNLATAADPSETRRMRRTSLWRPGHGRGTLP